MIDKDPTITSSPTDTAPRHEGEDVRRFTYDPSAVPTLTEAQINGIYEQACDMPFDVSDEDRVRAIYEQLTTAGVDLSQVQDGSLVVHYQDEKTGTDEVRAIDVRSHRNFGTRVSNAELVSVEKARQVDPAGHEEEESSHEQSNQLLDALEDKVVVLAENMREQVGQSVKDSHIINRFISMVDNLVAHLANGNPSISRETLGRLIDEAKEAQVIANREEVEAREGKTELTKLRDAVDTLQGLRTAEGVVLSQRTVSSSDMIATNSANNEGATSDIKLRIDAISRMLDEFLYSQQHGYEEYAHILRVHVNAVRPALEYHRALDRLTISDQNGLAELSRLLRDEKL